MNKSVSTLDLDFEPRVGDVVGCRVLILGYGGRRWRLIEADWYGDNIPGPESHSNSYDGRVWRHCGPARITRVTKTRVHFEFANQQ